MFSRVLKIPPMDLAAVLSQFQDFVWLDSADESGFSLYAIDSDEEFSWSLGDDLKKLYQFFNELDLVYNQQDKQDLPFEFTGGWIGYFSYESYGANPLIPFKPKERLTYPTIQFKRYNSFFYRHKNESHVTFVSFSKNGVSLLKKIENELGHMRPLPHYETRPLSQLRPRQTFKDYKDAFDVVKRKLIEGAFFELNLTQRFEAKLSSSPFALYLALREKALSPMMGYVQFNDLTILSASPENFFQVKGNVIETFPIKGTRRRGDTVREDLYNKTNLLQSEKDQAELLMVVDILRNDLGRICEMGSVEVPALMEAKTFPHYHHLISHIRGTLKKNVGFFDLFKALIPGGSITGAPKVEVIKTINEVELESRGIYTGALGFVSSSQKAKFNIPIRTATIQNGDVLFSTGGGIVVDSDVNQEYEECMLKAQIFTKLCESSSLYHLGLKS